MIDLASYFAPDHFLTISEPDLPAAIERLVSTLTPSDMRASAFSSVPLGRGILLCHARTSAIEGDLRVGVGFLAHPWRGTGQPEIHTIIVVIVPRDRARDYLTFLARLTRVLSSPAAADALMRHDVAGFEGLLRAHEHESKGGGESC